MREPCPVCGREPEVSEETYPPNRWFAECNSDNEDHKLEFMGWSERKAVNRWNAFARKCKGGE